MNPLTQLQKDILNDIKEWNVEYSLVPYDLKHFVGDTKLNYEFSTLEALFCRGLIMRYPKKDDDYRFGWLKISDPRRVKKNNYRFQCKICKYVTNYDWNEYCSWVALAWEFYITEEYKFYRAGPGISISNAEVICMDCLSEIRSWVLPVKKEKTLKPASIEGIKINLKL